MKKSPSDFTRFYPVFGFLIITIIMFSGLLQSGYIGQNDWIPSYDWTENLHRFGWTLDYFIHGGIFNLSLPTYPIIVFFSLLEAILGAAVANRLYVVIASTLGFYTMYLLAQRYTSSMASAFFAGLVYGVNPWVTSRICSSHYAFLLGNGLLPLFFYKYLEILEQIELKSEPRFEWKPIIYSAFLFALIGAMVPVHSLILCLIMSFIVFLVKACTIYKEKGGKWVGRLYSLVKVNIAIFSIGVAYCFYWIAPFFALFVSQGGKGSDGVFPYWLYNNVTPLNVLRLVAYWWTPFSKDIYLFSNPFLSSLWWIASCLPLLLVVVFIIWIKPKRSVHYFFLSLFFTGFALNMGRNLLGDIYRLFSFAGFYRDPDKYGAVVVFSYAFLSGIAVDRILQSLENKHTHYWRGGFLILLIVSQLFVNFPVLSGSFEGQITPLPMPQSYDIVNNWLKDEKGDFRVLWLPLDVYMSFSWSNRQIGDPAQFFSGKPTLNPALDPIRELSPGTSLALNYIQRLLYTNEAENLGKFLGLLNVKYIILRTDVLTPQFGEMYVRVLQGLDDFDISFIEGSLYVFENLFYLPKFRISWNNWNIVGGEENFDKLGRILPTFSGSSFNYLDRFSEPLSEYVEPRHGIFFSYLNVDETGIALAPQRSFYDAYDFTVIHNSSEGWIPVEASNIYSSSVMNHGVVTAQSSGLAFEIPLFLDDFTSYVFYIRCSGEKGHMTVSLDNEVRWIVDAPLKLSWLKLGNLNIQGGNHILKIMSGSAPNGLTVDEVFVMPRDQFNELKDSYIDLIQDNPFFLYGEAEDLISEGAFEKIEIDGFSGGYGVELTDGNGIEGLHRIRIPKDGLYTLQVRGSSFQNSETQFQFSSDTRYEVSSSVSLNTQLGWRKSNYCFLEEGVYIFSMEGTSAVIDALLLHLAKDTSLVTPKDVDVSLRVVANTPVYKSLKIEASAPFRVVFSGSYSDLWLSNLDGSSVELEMNDIFGMEVFVDDSNAREVTFTFTLQRYGWLGLAVSLSALLFTVLFFYFQKKRHVHTIKTLEEIRL